MVFAPVAFLEFLEVDESVVPGVEKEILLPALPIIRSLLDGTARQVFGARLQELERNQIEAKLAVRPPGAACEMGDSIALFHVEQRVSKGQV